MSGDLIGPLQARVMHHLWDNGHMATRSVVEAVNMEGAPADALAYTTVLTVLRHLYARGLVSTGSMRIDGRTANVWWPSVTREAYLDRVVRYVSSTYFRGSMAGVAQAALAAAPPCA